MCVCGGGGGGGGGGGWGPVEGGGLLTAKKNKKKKKKKHDCKVVQYCFSRFPRNIPDLLMTAMKCLIPSVWNRRM